MKGFRLKENAHFVSLCPNSCNLNANTSSIVESRIVEMNQPVWPKAFNPNHIHPVHVFVIFALDEVIK